MEEGPRFEVGDNTAQESTGSTKYMKGAHWKKLSAKRGHRRNVSEGAINLNSINPSSSSSSSSSNSAILPTNNAMKLDSSDAFLSKSISMSKLVSSPSNDPLNQGNFAFPYSLGSTSLAWMGNGLESVDIDTVHVPSMDEFGSPHKKGPPLKKATHRRAHSETLNESFLADFFHTPINKPDSSNTLLAGATTRRDMTLKQEEHPLSSKTPPKVNQMLVSQDAFEGTLGMSIDDSGIAPLLKVSSEDWHEAFQKQAEGSNEYQEMDFFRSHSFDTGGNGFQITADMGFSTDIVDIGAYSGLFPKPLVSFLPASSSSGEDKPWSKQLESSIDKVDTVAPVESFEIKTKKGSVKEKVVKEKGITKAAKKHKDKDQFSNQDDQLRNSSSVPTTHDQTDKPKDLLDHSPSKTINLGSSANANSISSTIWHNAKDYFEKGGADDDVGNIDNQQQSVDTTGNIEKYPGRGRYRCGRCGVLKTNHKCEYVEADICSQGTQAVAEVINTATGLPFEGDIVMAVSNRTSIHEPKVVETYNTYATDDTIQDSSTTWYRYPDGNLCLPTTTGQLENTASTTYSYIDADGNVAILAPNQAIHYEPDGTAYIITFDTAVTSGMTYGGMTINSDGTITNNMSLPSELMQMNISADQNTSNVTTELLEDNAAIGSSDSVDNNNNNNNRIT